MTPSRTVPLDQALDPEFLLASKDAEYWGQARNLVVGDLIEFDARIWAPKKKKISIGSHRMRGRVMKISIRRECKGVLAYRYTIRITETHREEVLCAGDSRTYSFDMEQGIQRLKWSDETKRAELVRAQWQEERHLLGIF